MAAVEQTSGTSLVLLRACGPQDIALAASLPLGLLLLKHSTAPSEI
ncbi:hypothetical protein [Arthrobacter sp. StoSoilB22]|nr:hypothetical protein [Arthrobacter sp. StoSoilB22]